MADLPSPKVAAMQTLAFLPQCSSSGSATFAPPSPRAQTLTSTLERWDFLRSPIKAGSSVVVKRERCAESSSSRAAGERGLEECVAEWREKRVKAGVPESECELPFLTNAPRMIECRICYRGIYPGEEVRCSVTKCRSAFHRSCAESKFKLPKQKVLSDDERNKKKRKCKPNSLGPALRCPHHECMVCKEVNNWRCVKCTVAAHTKCSPWEEHVLTLEGGKQAVCWRHPSNWLLQNEVLRKAMICTSMLLDLAGASPWINGTRYNNNNKAFSPKQTENASVTNNVKEVFDRLPVPYFEKEFSISSITTRDAADDSDDMIVKKEDVLDEREYLSDKKDTTCKEEEPTPFIRIKRNIYLVKRKRDSNTGVGCTGCDSESTCKDDCECRGLSVSCSKSCYCSGFCTNRPFRKEKKIRVVKTEHCGWGVIALEPLQKGDFIIEYIGEVIDDLTCEKRLWDMKKRGDSNFYMCEISKDFTIDATFKGNNSRFLNHSCDPNCSLEKWQVDGETRVGVFALRPIKVNEPLTYDYRFVHFGAKVVCKCGSENCQGSLGIKKVVQQDSVDMLEPSTSNSQLSRLHEPLQIQSASDDQLPSSWGCKTKRTEKIPRLIKPPISNSGERAVDRSNTETSSNRPLVPVTQHRILCWGRRIKRSYSTS